MVESLTALFWLFGLVAALYAALKGGGGWCYVWAALCFLFLGEETSWFQRLFDYSVPAVERINKQGEFNLHNLNLLQDRGGSAEGASGSALARLGSLINGQNLFRLGFVVYFGLIPLAARFRATRRIIDAVRLPLPSGYFLTCVWSLVVTSFVVLPLLQHRHGMAEVREMTYACFIFVYCATVLPRTRTAQTHQEHRSRTEAIR